MFPARNLQFNQLFQLQFTPTFPYEFLQNETALSSLVLGLIRLSTDGFWVTPLPSDLEVTAVEAGCGRHLVNSPTVRSTADIEALCQKSPGNRIRWRHGGQSEKWL